MRLSHSRLVSWKFEETVTFLPIVCGDVDKNVYCLKSTQWCIYALIENGIKHLKTCEEKAHIYTALEKGIILLLPLSHHQ